MTTAHMYKYHICSSAGLLLIKDPTSMQNAHPMIKKEKKRVTYSTKLFSPPCCPPEVWLLVLSACVLALILCVQKVVSWLCVSSHGGLAIKHPQRPPTTNSDPHTEQESRKQGDELEQKQPQGDDQVGRTGTGI